MADREVRYIAAEALETHADVEGARYWEVSLEQTMLTRFEVEPGARFPEHRHESEQITHVLEGTLRFEVAGRRFDVGAGDVIAIPGNVPHAVEALERTVAVDAWSPLPPRYRQEKPRR